MSACPICLEATDKILRLLATDSEIPLLRAQLEQESALDPLVVSPTGPVGLSQFTRSTWHEVMPTSPPEHRVDIYHAILAQVTYMRPLLHWAQTFAVPGDVPKFALAAYNAGREAIEKVKEHTFHAGLHPEIWSDVAGHLVFILGEHKTKEVVNYVKRIILLKRPI